MQTRVNRLGLALIVVTVAAILGGPLTPAVAGDAAAGKELYKQRCAQCHGEDGKANTAIAKALKPVPRDHTDGAD